MWYSAYVDCVHALFQLCFFFNLIYLFLEGKGGRKRERETSVHGCISCTPFHGPSQQPRHVAWLGIEPVTLCFAGRHSIHWAAPARAWLWFLFETLALGSQAGSKSLSFDRSYLSVHIALRVTLLCVLSTWPALLVWLVLQISALGPILYHVSGNCLQPYFFGAHFWVFLSFAIQFVQVRFLFLTSEELGFRCQSTTVSMRNQAVFFAFSFFL